MTNLAQQNACLAYQRRMNRVCDYIYAHLDDELNVEELSQVAHFSKFHFHRQFSLYLGLSVAKFVQLLRLKRASYQLVFAPDMKVIDIALQAKFEHPESFARAFKKEFQQSPSQFRQQPNWLQWHQNHKVGMVMTTNQTIIDQVEVKKFESTLVAVKQHQGSPQVLNESIQTFINWRKSTGLSPVTSSRTFGVVYNDPHNTPPEEFRFDICGEVSEAIPDNEFGIVNKSIVAGRYAVLRHVGAHDQMDDKIYSLYRDWLPQSGEELRDAPMFFHYLNLFPDVAEYELVTDIYLPIK